MSNFEFTEKEAIDLLKLWVLYCVEAVSRLSSIEPHHDLRTAFSVHLQEVIEQRELRHSPMEQSWLEQLSAIASNAVEKHIEVNPGPKTVKK